MSEESPQPEAPAVLSETPPPLPPSARPWGFFATLGWAVVILLAYVIAQGVTVAIFIATGGGPASEFKYDGKLLALTTIVGAPVIFILCTAVASLRKFLGAKTYLALRWPSSRVLARWTIISLAFAAVSDGASSIFDKQIVPEFMTDAWESAGLWKPLLLLAVIVAAPVAEETFFRGFLFAGFRKSRLGFAGAMLLTSAAWASIHLQYDLYGMITVFALGLMLATAREKTNSLFLCMFVHALNNLIATIEMLVYQRIIG